ncbi:MAG TPA: sigma-54 dependent transcriptional regulator [Polyangiaceae bacterium]|nr:sigma-54 dependent transcriptional regulator [Polyangiaceae bacterium]
MSAAAKVVDIERERELRRERVAPAPGTAVLVVDDDREMCELVEAELTQRNYAVTWRTAPSEALELLESEDFSVLLADIHMEGMGGLELCRAALAKRPDLVAVVMTGFGTMDHAIGAMRAGAYDFVTKPISMDALALTIARAASYRAMSDELRRLRRRVETHELPHGVGSSGPMQRVAEVVARVAATNTNVLITGESGTGKELVARALHERSGRKGPFLAINCAALPENLLESELFGHARGAFTDARAARPGLLVEADQGTLFLDEIGDLPLGMQPKILRALQERTVRPLGSTQEIPFDARIVAATNRDLELEVEHKRFREDLFYRINVVRIDVPPLRVRGNDVLELAQHFLQRAAARSNKNVTRLGRLVADRLVNYDWPGNVRELENCMERAVALTSFDEITLDDLPAKLREYRPTEVYAPSDDPKDLPPMHVVEERYMRKVLAAVSGNKTLAAKVLGLDRRTLYRKLERQV